ncbi:MAG: class I SAM-dependent DNA methyltransferase [Candidatus Methylomirabilales bacterium]
MPLPAYRRFAEAYDWEGSLDFSRQAFRRVSAACREHGLSPGRHLDLGCGTGTLAILMAKTGWEVVGLDASEAMLAQAKQKAQEAGQAVEFVQQDMRHLKVVEPVNLVTAFYDTLNHLLFAEDLEAAFRGAAGALLPGGLFVFDVNTEATFQRIWGGVTHLIDTSRASTIYQTSYDPDTRLAKGLVTGFLRRGDLYEKFEEEIVERYWPPEDVERHLATAGFRSVERETFNPFPLPGGGDLKWLWIVNR